MVTAYFNDLGVEARYWYDCGDSWWHKVTVKGYISHEKGLKYPKCFGGERACSPEDCRGNWGYYDLIEVLFDPKNKKYKE